MFWENIKQLFVTQMAQDDLRHRGVRTRTARLLDRHRHLIRNKVYSQRRVSFDAPSYVQRRFFCDLSPATKET